MKTKLRKFGAWLMAAALAFAGAGAVQAVPGRFAEMICPVWVGCYIVSFFAQHPALNLAKKLSGMQ